jgi:hypothetical protein
MPFLTCIYEVAKTQPMLFQLLFRICIAFLLLLMVLYYFNTNPFARSNIDYEVGSFIAVHDCA